MAYVLVAGCNPFERCRGGGVDQMLRFAVVLVNQGGGELRAKLGDNDEAVTLADEVLRIAPRPGV